MVVKTDTLVKFGSLEPGSYDYQFTLNDEFFADYKNEKILGGKVLFDVKMDKKAQSLMFYFTFKGTVNSECDRCMGPVSVGVEGNDTLYMEFSDTATESDRDDMIFLKKDETRIDLGQWMYEYVAVAMPMRCLHEEGQCDPEITKYITEETDTETEPQEIDSRWAPLQALMSDSEKDNKRIKIKNKK